MNSFENLRVLEIAEGIAGPVCGLQLADIGADVVKIEPPDGDRSREWGPPMLGDTAAIFVHLNRGKRSVMLDLYTQAGMARLRRMMSTAHIVILHMDPTDRRTLSLDWEEVLHHQPDLVAVEIDDLGPQGVLSHLPGSELVVQAMSGFTRYLGAPGGEPVRVGYEIAGMAAGMHAFHAAAAALYQVRQGHGGQLVRVSALKALLSMKGILLCTQDKPDKWEGFHLHGPLWPADIGKRTRDGQVTIDFRPGRRDDWEAFCRRAGLEHLIDDPDFADHRSTFPIGDRWHLPVSEAYDAWFASLSSAEASAVINEVGGISVKFQNYVELLAHPQIEALDPLVQVADARAPVQVGTPYRFSTATVPAAGAAPDLGADQDAWE